MYVLASGYMRGTCSYGYLHTVATNRKWLLFFHQPYLPLQGAYFFHKL